ncbi:MAG: amidohydrolase [Oceanospirillaceae bacterium]|nr:amidohydrolase [Oceanospirillaceae bacterium]
MAAVQCLLLGSIAGAALADEKPAAAELLLVNGRIYTEDAARPWVEAVAVRDGLIQAVGDDAALAAYRGKQTRVIDLGGKMAMPGLIDAHVHPIWGALKNLFQCKFAFTATPDEVAEAIESCAKKTDSDWVRGGQWNSDFFKSYGIASPRAWLDQVSGTKAVVLTDDTGHNIWANSEALRRLDIDTDTPQPEGVEFVRDAATGELNGLLMEGNNYLKTTMPDWTDRQYLEAARQAVDIANGFGITGLKDADASEAVVRAYHAVDVAEGLDLRVATSMRRPSKEAKNTFDFAEFQHMRDSYASVNLNTANVKIYLDGVPTSAQTAAMLEPYAGEGHGHDDGAPAYGTLLVEPAQLDAVIQEFDGLGFTVKLHAAGDRAIRVALDAIEKARAANGDSGLHHELAHAEYIDAADLPRFTALGAVADFAPYIWYPSPIADAIQSAVGERARQAFPARDLIDSGARIVAGSDWPSAVADMNPWPGLEALITREDPYGKQPGALWKEQAISLEEALNIFTRNGAEALGAADQTGSLQVGKSADIIVLNQNLFEIPLETISETKVLTTLFKGREVFNADAH